MALVFKQSTLFLKRLYLIDKDLSDFRLISNRVEDLEIYPEEARVIFVITPEPAELSRTWSFLDKFHNPKTTALEFVGRDILIVGEVAQIRELLRVFDFVSIHRSNMEYKAVTLNKIEPDDMSKILGNIF